MTLFARTLCSLQRMRVVSKLLLSFPVSSHTSSYSLPIFRSSESIR